MRSFASGCRGGISSTRARRRRDMEQRQGGQRRFEVSIKGLSTPTPFDSEIPANATLLSVSRKSPVNLHNHPLPGQRERQRALSVSDPLTPANATWLSVSRKGPVKPHSRPLPGQRARSSNTRQPHMVFWYRGKSLVGP